MSCNGWKHLKNYRLNDDFCARNIEMRDASRKKTGSSHIRYGELIYTRKLKKSFMKSVGKEHM